MSDTAYINHSLAELLSHNPSANGSLSRRMSTLHIDSGVPTPTYSEAMSPAPSQISLSSHQWRPPAHLPQARSSAGLGAHSMNTSACLSEILQMLHQINGSIDDLRSRVDYTDRLLSFLVPITSDDPALDPSGLGPMVFFSSHAPTAHPPPSSAWNSVLDRIDYPSVTYWTRDQLQDLHDPERTSTQKGMGPKTKTHAAPKASTGTYLQYADGVPVGKMGVRLLKEAVRMHFHSWKRQGVSPSVFSEADPHLLPNVFQSLYDQFPYLRYCADHYKAILVMQEVYPEFKRDHLDKIDIQPSGSMKLDNTALITMPDSEPSETNPTSTSSRKRKLEEAASTTKPRSKKYKHEHLLSLTSATPTSTSTTVSVSGSHPSYPKVASEPGMLSPRLSYADTSTSELPANCAQAGDISPGLDCTAANSNSTGPELLPFDSNGAPAIIGNHCIDTTRPSTSRNVHSSAEEKDTHTKQEPLKQPITVTVTRRAAIPNPIGSVRRGPPSISAQLEAQLMPTHPSPSPILSHVDSGSNVDATKAQASSGGIEAQPSASASQLPVSGQPEATATTRNDRLVKPTNTNSAKYDFSVLMYPILLFWPACTGRNLWFANKCREEGALSLPLSVRDAYDGLPIEDKTHWEKLSKQAKQDARKAKTVGKAATSTVHDGKADVFDG